MHSVDFESYAFPRLVVDGMMFSCWASAEMQISVSHAIMNVHLVAKMGHSVR
jgi:hypothetical protein